MSLILQELAEEPDSKSDEVLAALKAMTRTFLDGSHYETTNPYCRPVVRDALRAIAHAEGKSAFGNDWMDALSLTD